MPIVPVNDPHDSRIAEYRNVPDGVLLRDLGLFVAEGRLVVRQLLAAPRVQARSLLVTQGALDDLGDVLGDHTPFPVYLAARPVMSAIVGFNIHRGCLGLGVRPPPTPIAELIVGPVPAMAVGPELGPSTSYVSRLIVLEAVSNVDNIGAIFRAVAGLGGHAVVVGPGCGDPLYRKAIRTSMGATLRVPFAGATAWPQALHDLRASGFTLVGLTPEAGSEPLEDVAADLRARARVALMVGAEGAGLSAAALGCTDVRVRIPMAPGIDSLNVATATAIALYRIA
jgi:tRNA G18 (ribose-2'-O)-methylase SpoU